MPWKVSDVSKYSKDASTRKLKRAWVSVANSTLKTCMTDGGSESDCAAKAIRTANGVIKKRKAKEMEKQRKIVGEVELPASAFLVVGDKTDPETWHLPVMNEDGELQPNLMSAAWCALHEGYRGNKFEGKGKGTALTLLEAYYKQLDIDPPTDDDDSISEYGYIEEYIYVPWGVYTFDHLDALTEASKRARKVHMLTDQFTGLVRNIISSLEGDKLAALRTVSDEYIDRLDEVMADVDTDVPGDDMDDDSDMEAEESLPIFREAESMSIIELKEHDGEEQGPLTLKVQIIQPGWGNKIDNHYYPREVVERDAPRFVDAKMFETDHREEQYSTKNWVSTIDRIVGFTESGAPIAEVVVHDDDFAKRLRNLNAAKKLHRMECSIYAAGTAKGGFELDGRKGKQITAISEVVSVDWVTRAGAGGRALELSENSKVGGDMKKKPDDKEAEVEETTTAEVEQEQAVAITEAGADDKPAAEGTTEQATDAAAQDEPENEGTTSEPEALSQEEVDKVLASFSLPVPVVERLKALSYQTEDKLKETVAAEVKYLEAVTGAGKPVAMGEAHKNTTPKPDPEKVAEAANRVFKKHFRR